MTSFQYSKESKEKINKVLSNFFYSDIANIILDYTSPVIDTLNIEDEKKALDEKVDIYIHFIRDSSPVLTRILDDLIDYKKRHVSLHRLLSGCRSYADDSDNHTCSRCGKNEEKYVDGQILCLYSKYPRFLWTKDNIREIPKVFSNSDKASYILRKFDISCIPKNTCFIMTTSYHTLCILEKYIFRETIIYVSRDLILFDKDRLKKLGKNSRLAKIDDITFRVFN